RDDVARVSRRLFEDYGKEGPPAMKRLLTQCAAALAAAVALAVPAYADPAWTYTTKATPLAIAPDTPGRGLILTRPASVSAAVTGTAPSGIVATTVLGSISTGNDHYSGAGYHVDITIKDGTVDSGGTFTATDSHVFTFAGQFSGDFSATAGANI